MVGPKRPWCEAWHVERKMKWLTILPIIVRLLSQECDLELACWMASAKKGSVFRDVVGGAERDAEIAGQFDDVTRGTATPWWASSAQKDRSSGRGEVAARR